MSQVEYLEINGADACDQHCHPNLIQNRSYKNIKNISIDLGTKSLI